jgi:hypothetical protein
VGPWETGLETCSKFNVLIIFCAGLDGTNMIFPSTLYGISYISNLRNSWLFSGELQKFILICEKDAFLQQNGFLQESM